MGSKVSFEEQVRVRAYEIFVKRAENGDAGGSPEQDWLQAEEEVREEVRSRQQPAAPPAPPARATPALASAPEAPAPASTPRKSVKTTKPTTANRRSH